MRVLGYNLKKIYVTTICISLLIRNYKITSLEKLDCEALVKGGFI